MKKKFDRPYADNPVNFVVVGLGMGKNRCRQIEETNGTNLYGVFDVNEKLCKEIGEQFNVKYSTDINTFLNDDKVEVMYIVTPTGLHCSVAEQCLNAGKHVLVTKPMDVNTANCDRAIELAKEKGLIFGVDFDNHFRKPFMELKRAVEEGFFGKILFADVALNINRTQEYYDYDTGWRGTWELDGVTVKLKVGFYDAYVNGKHYKLDVPSQIVNGRTLIPVRFVAEAFGAEVIWDDETKTVHISGVGKKSQETEAAGKFFDRFSEKS